MIETGTDDGLKVGDSAADAARRRGLRRMRTLAVSLLILAAIVFALTHGRDGAWAYVNAASEAAMVGAIADWFAVVALFKHPLKLPIPHTAIIPKRKESLGESLQEFVAENFLKADVVRERITSAQVSKQAGAWLVDPSHADRIVAIGSRMTADALARVKESDVDALIREALVPKMLDEPLAPAVGELLSEIIRDRAHDGFVDLVLAELHRWLRENDDKVTELLEQRAPWWTPQWLDKSVAERVHVEVVAWVAEIRSTPHHRARQAFDHWITELAHGLQHVPATQERFERLKARVLLQPQMTSTSIRLWDALRRGVIGALEDENGLLRARAVEEVMAFGTRLRDEEALAERVDGLLADGASYVVERYGHQLATVISATVNRWDGKETADRIELHVGRDLQFIRINGTVVGGLAGLLIHAFSELL